MLRNLGLRSFSLATTTTYTAASLGESADYVVINSLIENEDGVSLGDCGVFKVYEERTRDSTSDCLDAGLTGGFEDSSREGLVEEVWDSDSGKGEFCAYIRERRGSKVIEDACECFFDLSEGEWG